MEVLGPEDNVEYKVTLGSTFNYDGGNREYHTIQCLRERRSQAASETNGIVSKDNDVIDIEFKQGDADLSYYRGNYKPSKVECLLIYHGPEKGFTLEKLSGSAKGLKPGKKTERNIEQALNPPVQQTNISQNDKAAKRSIVSPSNPPKKRKVTTPTDNPPESRNYAAPTVQLERSRPEFDSDSSSSEDDLKDLISQIDEHVEPNAVTSAPIEETKESSKQPSPLQPPQLSVQPTSNIPPSNPPAAGTDESLFTDDSSSSDSSSDDSSSSSSDSSDSDSDSEADKQQTQQNPK
jgi:hypothetical protein